jgi:anti-sigma regulatory factor (Ser/Thr protein kinase)
MYAIPFKLDLLGEITLPYTEESTPQARKVVGAWLGAGHPASYDVRLAVSELVTNSIRYATRSAATGIVLRLFDCGHFVHVEVQDQGSQTTPRVQAAQAMAEDFQEGGRGLFIVDSISREWGVRFCRRSGATIVWCDITADPELPEPTGV